MAIEHILTDADTVQNLAYRYLGDASRWKEIVDYNSLEYPYTLTSKEARGKLHASGYLTVTRELFSSPLTVYKGSLFSSKIDNQGIRKLYEVVEDTTIPAGQSTGYVFVRCTTYGTFGNVIAGYVTQIFDVQSSLGDATSSLVIDNPEPFTNGVDATVKVTGEAVYIPSEGEERDIQALINVDSFLYMLGGEDLTLTEDGDLSEDGRGDLATVSGLGNIQQAIKNRLMTERGSLPHHPEYGTRLAELIGKSQAPYILKLMELDIHETLAYDERISGVNVNSIEVSGTTLYVDLTLEISKVGDTFRLQLDF